MTNTVKTLKSYVLPPLFVSVTMSALSAAIDLSTVSVAVGAAFGVAFWYWDRDRRSVAVKVLGPG
jgi:hypothetical protein